MFSLFLLAIVLSLLKDIAFLQAFLPSYTIAIMVSVFVRTSIDHRKGASNTLIARFSHPS